MLKKMINVFIISIFLMFLGCQSEEIVIIEDNTQEEKMEDSENNGSTFSSKGNYKNVVRDSVDYSSCDEKDAIEYDGKYFCSQKTLNSYKMGK